MMRASSILLAPLLLPFLALGADQTATTGSVTAEFMGASGGMKLFTDSSRFLMISQEKLQEVSSTGGACPKCTSINVAGLNSWSPLVELKKDNVTTVYSTNFSVSSSGTDFTLTAHLARTTSTVQEATPCSGCSNTTMGECKEATTNKCAAAISGVCLANSTLCTETVTVIKDQLKFSFVVKGLTFSDAANKFTYGIELKDKKGTKPAVDVGTAGVSKVRMDGGHVDLPTVGTIKGGTADKDVTATITTETVGSKTIINFKFDSWAANESLYYDPTLVMGGASVFGPSMSVLLLAMVALFV